MSDLKNVPRLYEAPARRYARQEYCGKYGFEIPPGWFRLLEGVFQEIDEVIQSTDKVLSSPWKDFKITCVKQKFWKMRIYFEGAPPEHRDKIQAILHKYEGASHFRCTHCGEAQEMSIGKFPFCGDTCNEEAIAARLERSKQRKAERERKREMENQS